jgi:diacylglycerol kinase
MYAIEASHLSKRFRDIAALAVFILVFQYAANGLYKKFNE